MSDVLEVITKLTYSVDDTSGLKAVVDNFQKQATEIERVTKLRVKLQDQIDKGTNPAATAKYKSAVDDLTKRIEYQTGALTKQFNASKLVQSTITQELGIIQKLTDKINDLNHARERQTSVAGIAAINTELARTRMELDSLTAESSGNGLLRILGIGGGNIGSQLVRGTLEGFGIGAGLSILPSVISHMIEYSKSLLDADGAQQKAAESALKFSEAIVKEVQAISEAAQLTRDIVNLGDAQSKRDVDNAKATGVIRGEQFEEQKRIFEKEQADRKRKLADLKEEQELLKGLGVANAEAGQNGEFQKVIDNPGAFGVSTQVTEALQIRLAQLKKDGVKEEDLYRQLGAQVVKQLEANDEKKKNIEAQINDAAIGRQSKLNEEVYQLNIKLSDKLTSLQNENIQKSVSYEEKHQDNLNNLILSNETSRQDDLRRFDEEKLKERQQLAEKGQTISAGTEEKYGLLRLEIINEYNQKELQIIEEHTRRRIDAENKINDLLINIRGNSLGNENGVNNASGTQNLQTILEEQQAHAGLLVSKLAEQHQQQLVEARKFNDNTRELEEQQAIEEKYLAEKLNREKLDKQLKYYSDVLNLVKEKGQQLLLEQLAQGTNQGANANRFLSGNESAGAFRYRSTRANFKDTRNQLNAEISNKDKELSQAKQNQDDIVNNPESTAADIAKIDKEVNQLIVDKQKLNNQKAELISSEQIRQVNIAIDAFKSLSDIAVQSFNTIAQARDQDLSREISVREQRVSLALKIAEKGNVEALNLEQKRLDAANQQKKKDALEQLSINQALIVSNSILAVVKSAVEAGPLAPVTILTTIAALAAGFAAVKAIDNASKAQFFHGGYTGDGDAHDAAGTVHKKEFVSNAATTAKYRPILEAMHRGEPFIQLPQMLTPQIMPAAVGTNFASKAEIAELKEAVYSVVDAVHGKTVNVSQVMNERGLTQRVEEIKTTERRRWRN